MGEAAYEYDFEQHKTLSRFLVSYADIRALFCGNQAGKTRAMMEDVKMRLLGTHPVGKRNRIEDPIRCVSKCLPKNDEDEENQMYVEFKKIFPPNLIKKDITFRTNHMILRDPKGGSDKKLEYMSKKQEIDAFMAVQRSALYQDEEIDRRKWDECQARLLIPGSKGQGGDTVIGLTPVRGLDWTYDSVWRRACKIFRSDTIVEKFKLPEIEETDTGSNIEAFCWATDENPLMDEKSIDRIFGDIDDPDEYAMRRYGIFRQVTGRIYKSFEKGHR